MTQKTYKTARGKTVDVGALRLQNEHIRAVGNMGVNARGDRINSEGTVIDSRNQQLQRQINRQTNVSDGQVQDNIPSNRAANTLDALNDDFEFGPGFTMPEETVNIPVVEPVTAPAPVDAEVVVTGGLAAAIARAKTVKQELEKTARQQAQAQGLRKI